MSDFEGEPIPGRTNAFDLTEEQQNTASLLDRLLGKTVSDRYIDFCRLSAGAFDLRVPSPLAGHALREMESILRQTLAAPFEAVVVATEGEQARAQTALDALSDLGYDEDTLERVANVLQPNVHKEQIRKICARLGLAEDGDVAKAWLSITGAHKKAHERPFNRTLAIDGAFRAAWSDPFNMVVRSVAVELQGKYTALTDRVEELAAMADKDHAVVLYLKEIPGALSLQWHFFRTISGPQWLREFLRRGVIVEPLPYTPEEAKAQGLRKWPVGHYLLGLAKTDDPATHPLVTYALKPLATSVHPDVRRDGIEILANLPARESARAIDLAKSWLGVDEFFFGIHFAEQLMTRLAGAGETAACLSSMPPSRAY